ncbi:hypothetical protein DMUE_4043 [Dictyocoela muelleri]|nr:hypothetical protein DMUE_4043 [Dictyocoela muelleri]
MLIKLSTDEKRNLCIATITIIVLFLLFTGFYIYGYLVVSNANEKQSEIIRGSENFNGEKKKLFDIVFKRLNDKNLNCFLFEHDKDKIVLIKNKFENISDLRELCLFDNIEDYDFDQNEILTPDGGSYIELILCFSELFSDELIEENSWAGSFYKITGGYSLPDTFSEFSKYLKYIEIKLDRGYVGAAIFDDKVCVFFYNKYEDQVVDTYEIYGMDDKVTALEILKYFITINAIKNEE